MKLPTSVKVGMGDLDGRLGQLEVEVEYTLALQFRWWLAQLLLRAAAVLLSMKINIKARALE